MSGKLILREEKLGESDYKLLAELLLTRTIIFNKRRQAEVQELTVKNLYESLQADEHQEIVKSLTTAEQILAKRYEDLPNILGRLPKFSLLYGQCKNCISGIFPESKLICLQETFLEIFGKIALLSLHGLK